MITGAGSGIGRASALLFAEEGYRVVVVDRSETAGADTARMIVARGGSSLLCVGDVTRETEVQGMIVKVLDAFGRIDGAVNSAGVEGRASDLIHSTEADWDNVIGTNLKGVWLCMKYQLPIMSAQGKGSIVNLSSVAGLEGSPGASLYSASKHGVIGLSRSAALEFARKGIRINVVCPGPVETPMIERVIQARTASRDSLIAREPMGRMAAASEVADAVFWLCSERSGFVTGVTLPVDGGWLTR